MTTYQFFTVLINRKVFITYAENLSTRSSTTLLLSSTYVDRTATYANDGNQVTTFSQCSHTDLNKPIAWIQVDLGVSYSISYVALYYRKDGKLVCLDDSEKAYVLYDIFFSHVSFEQILY